MKIVNFTRALSESETFRWKVVVSLEPLFQQFSRGKLERSSTRRSKLALLLSHVQKFTIIVCKSSHRAYDVYRNFSKTGSIVTLRRTIGTRNIYIYSSIFLFHFTSRKHGASIKVEVGNRHAVSEDPLVFRPLKSETWRCFSTLFSSLEVIFLL